MLVGCVVRGLVVLWCGSVAGMCGVANMCGVAMWCCEYVWCCDVVCASGCDDVCDVCLCSVRGRERCGVVWCGEGGGVRLS
jgi:hypothetical protein